MLESDDVLTRLREICLAFPDSTETLTWGKPHFRVGDKIFAGFGVEKGRPAIGFKLDMEHADHVVRTPRFWRTPYVGHKGWVSMDAERVIDWAELRALISESYRLIAPKASLAKLEAATSAAPRSGQARRRPASPAVKRPPRK